MDGETFMQACITERVQLMTRQANRASHGLMHAVTQTVVDDMRAYLPDPGNSQWARANARSELLKHLSHLHQQCYTLAKVMVDDLTRAPSSAATTPEPLGAGLFAAGAPTPSVHEEHVRTMVHDVSRIIFHVLGYKEEEDDDYPWLVRHVVVGQWNESILDWAFSDDAVVREWMLAQHPHYDWRADETMDRDRVAKAYASIKASAETVWRDTMSTAPPLPPLTPEAMRARLDHGSLFPSALFGNAPVSTRVIEAAPNLAFTSRRHYHLARLMSHVEHALVLDDGAIHLSTLLLGIDGIRPTLLAALAAGRLPWVMATATAPPPAPLMTTVKGARDGVEVRAWAEQGRMMATALATAVVARPTSTTAIARREIEACARRWLDASPRLAPYLGLLQEQAGVNNDMPTFLSRLFLTCGVAGPLHELEMIHGLEATPSSSSSTWQRIRSWYSARDPAMDAAVDQTIEEGKRADRQFLTSTLCLHLFDQLVSTMLHQLHALMPAQQGDDMPSVERLDHERALFEQQVGRVFEGRKAGVLPRWYQDMDGIIDNVTAHGGYGPFDVTKSRAESPALDMPYISRDLVELAALGTAVRGDLYLHWMMRAMGRWRTERQEEPYRGIVGACRRIAETMGRTGARFMFAQDEGGQEGEEEERIEDLLSLSNLDLLGTSLAAVVMQSLGGHYAIGTAAFSSLHDVFIGRPPQPPSSRLMQSMTVSPALFREEILAHVTADPFRCPPDMVIRPEDAARLAPLVYLLHECIRRRSSPEQLEHLAAAVSGSPLMMAWLDMTRTLVERYRRMGVLGGGSDSDSFDYWVAARSPRVARRDDDTGQVTSVGDAVTQSGGVETWPYCMLAELVAHLPVGVLSNQPTLGYMLWKRI